MLHSLQELEGHTLAALDGEIGRCVDFLVDDEDWAVRYMVADTGTWLPKRKVLISPISLDGIDWERDRVVVELEKEQIESAPQLESHAPVSRQYELAYSQHLGFAPYWIGAGVWGQYGHPIQLRVDSGKPTVAPPSPQEVHLRSANELLGYGIAARDGGFGHVEDFVLDDRTWMLRYLVIDTKDWLPGKHVRVSPEVIEGVSFEDRTLRVGMTKEQIEESPRFDARQPVNMETKVQLVDMRGEPLR